VKPVFACSFRLTLATKNLRFCRMYGCSAADAPRGIRSRLLQPCLEAVGLRRRQDHDVVLADRVLRLDGDTERRLSRAPEPAARLGHAGRAISIIFGARTDRRRDIGEARRAVRSRSGRRSRGRRR
jgi:hypothetical protein